MEEDLPEPLPPADVFYKPNRLGRTVKFPSRVAAAGDDFIGQGVALKPHACLLGSAGRQPSKCTECAGGVWRGIVEGASGEKAAAALVAPLLAGTVRLHAEGVLIASEVDPSSLRFMRVDAEGPEAEQAAEVLTGRLSAFRLAGRHGQVLSHRAGLWMVARADGGFDVLLLLQPRVPGRAGFMRVAQDGPLGPSDEVWEEVPMVELPQLLRLMVDKGGNGTVATTDRFLVEEDEETLVMHCWRRRGMAGEAVTDDGEPLRLKSDALSLEELLWHDTMSALAETAPCAEAPVPASRLRLADEGVVSRQELLEEVLESEHGVSDQDAPRLGSVAFLRQYVKREVLEEEVLARLLPSGCGSARILSAELLPPEGPESSGSGAGGKPPPSAPRPKSIDDLFSDTADFRKPAPWSSTDDDEDPLALHELTSVFLVNETVGFALAFHCLQAIDPCAV